MLKYVNYDIVFQEFPDEVTLAVNLSGCPNLCAGCHSAYLREDTGEELTPQRLAALIDSYNDEITCVALMGGDNDPQTVLKLLAGVQQQFGGRLRTGWYSGRTWQPSVHELKSSLNYLKLGPYIAAYGPLSAPNTNQRIYKVDEAGQLHDITHRMRK